MLYSIVGANGFIGNRLCSYLKEKGHEVKIIGKNDSVKDVYCGTIIYAAGFGDCREPSKVIDANLNYLIKVTSDASFDRIIYFSSTRLYIGLDDSNENSDCVILNSDGRNLFNLTKLCAEKYLSNLSKAIIVRPSNVYGPAYESPLFLPSLVRDAVNKNEITMYISKEYAKDYIHVDDVCNLVEKISASKKPRKVYNLASGFNLTASDISKNIVELTGCSVVWTKENLDDEFPIIDIRNIREEFDFEPLDFSFCLSEMVNSFQGCV
ncbi:NAD-dependent epimerase/dehydratase family protein [Vibrio splendidus]|uniref:NAD-dependent epimerase/dehydratase family protein n=1 Tax=Vibrio splendidus TaxID=29497 RepID=UPI0015E7DDFE|nr:SDR family oxidoreductase [Vibrio splendidus]